MNEFERFVEWTGGRKEAAQLLRCSYELVCMICRGDRGISKDIAARVVEVSKGEFSLVKLLYGDAA